MRRVTTLAEELQQALTKPLPAGQDREFVISCSIGISRYPEDALTADELIHHADLAMYRVKRSGKCGYGFYHSEKNRE
jgi:diguanylate cyclase (GGDEF)-like protein